jgi:hypothetical protein
MSNLRFIRDAMREYLVCWEPAGVQHDLINFNVSSLSPHIKNFFHEIKQKDQKVVSPKSLTGSDRIAVFGFVCLIGTLSSCYQVILIHSFFFRKVIVRISSVLYL